MWLEHWGAGQGEERAAEGLGGRLGAERSLGCQGSSCTLKRGPCSPSHLNISRDTGVLCAADAEGPGKGISGAEGSEPAL